MRPLRIAEDGRDGLGGVADDERASVLIDHQAGAFKRVPRRAGDHVTVCLMVHGDLDQFTDGACAGLVIGLDPELMLQDAANTALLIGHFSGLAVRLPVVLFDQGASVGVGRDLAGHERPSASQQSAVLIAKALRIEVFSGHSCEHTNGLPDGGDERHGAGDQASAGFAGDVPIQITVEGFPVSNAFCFWQFGG